MPGIKRLLALFVAVLLVLVPAAIAQGAPGGGPGKPDGAGNGGGGGGNPNKGPGQKLGDLYADLWVIARYVDGTPIVDSEGCLRPITDVAVGAPINGAGVYPYEHTMYAIPLVHEQAALAAVTEDEDELEPCDVQAEFAYLVDEVDLGRLNLGRAPERVLLKQLRDVEAFLAAGPVTLDASGRFTRVADDVTLDSPLANLAAYQSILETGMIGATAVPSVPLDDMELTAAQLAAGAPKEGFVITVDTVQYLNRILQVPQQTTVMPTLTAADELFLDLSGFGTYTRSATFPGCVEWYPIGSSELMNEPLAEVALGGGALSGTGIDGYVKFAEDAHKVLVFLHALGDNVQQVDPITESAVCGS